MTYSSTTSPTTKPTRFSQHSTPETTGRRHRRIQRVLDPRRRRPRFERHVALLTGQQLFLASQTLAELRYGALVAGWGDARRLRLETAVASATVVPLSDALITEAAHLRFECRQIGHPLAADAHAADLWIAATARHVHTVLVTADLVFEHTPGLDVAPA